VVDTLWAAAADAAAKSGQKWVSLSPNTLKEVAADAQGLGAFSWPV
jgi:hypothetical protein